MTIARLKEFSRCCLKGRIPFNAKAKQLMELHKNMCKHPEKWDLPKTFGKEANTDWVSFWMAFNRVRFGGVPWDPRNVPKEWKNLPEAWLIRLMVKSHKPKQLSDENSPDFLTKKEAHEWLCWISNSLYPGLEWRNDPTGSWFRAKKNAIARRGLPAYNSSSFLLATKARDLLHRPRDMGSRLLVDWIIEKHKLATWNTPCSRFDHQAGGHVNVYMRQVLDEIRVTDLTDGIRTSPEKVLAAVMYRRSDAFLETVYDQLKVYPTAPENWLNNPVSGVEVIQSADRLVAEGKELQHCVATYYDRIKTGLSHIVSVVTVDGRSTAEVSMYGSIFQHRAQENRNPPEANKQLLGQWTKAL